MHYENVIDRLAPEPVAKSAKSKRKQTDRVIAETGMVFCSNRMHKVPADKAKRYVSASGTMVRWICDDCMALRKKHAYGKAT